MPLSTSIQGALQNTLAQQQFADQAQGGVFDNSFLIDVNGQGQAFVPLSFNVRYVEKPFVLTGWEMAPGQRALIVPVISAGVFVWKFGKVSATGALFYDGCTMAINVYAGATDLSATVNVSFRGTALRNPAGR